MSGSVYASKLSYCMDALNFTVSGDSSSKHLILSGLSKMLS
jgi:hypothetical protein